MSYTLILFTNADLFSINIYYINYQSFIIKLSLYNTHSYIKAGKAMVIRLLTLEFCYRFRWLPAKAVKEFDLGAK